MSSALSREKISGLFEVLLPGFNLHIEIILIRRDDADVLLVIDTGGVVGHIEVDDRFIPRHYDLSIEVATSPKSSISIGFIPKGDKEMVAARGFVKLHYIFFAVELKSNPSISDVSLLYPLIGQELCVVFGVHDVVLVSFDLSLEMILQVDGIIR